MGRLFFYHLIFPFFQKASKGLLLFTNGALGWYKHPTLQWLGILCYLGMIS